VSAWLLPFGSRLDPGLSPLEAFLTVVAHPSWGVTGLSRILLPCQPSLAIFKLQIGRISQRLRGLSGWCSSFSA
jgi:hypothetical protein